MKEIQQFMVRQTFPQMFNSAVVKYAELRCQWWKTGPTTTASLNYAEVGQIVQELTSGLMCLGVVKGDRVTIMARNCPQWLWADFSVLCAAAVTVTMFPKCSQREIADSIADSESRILFVDDEINLKKVFRIWDDLPCLEKVIVMQDDFVSDHPEVMNLSQVRNLGVRFLFRHPDAFDMRWQSVGLHDLMTIVYSSGVSGHRRGVVHTHNSMNAGLLRDIRNTKSSSDDVFLSILSLSYLYERLSGQMVALTVGATIAYAEQPSSVVDDIQVFNPTFFCAVPAIYEQLFMSISDRFSGTPEGKNQFDMAVRTAIEVTRACEDQEGFIDISPGNDFRKRLPLDLLNKFLDSEPVFDAFRAVMGNRFRLGYSGVRTLSQEVYRTFIASGIRIFDGYGITETANSVTGQDNRIQPGAFGPLNPGFQGKILNTGEFAFKGPTLFREYLNEPRYTEESFTPDGFFKTGDIVEFLPDGNIRFIGRMRDQLILANGMRVGSSKIKNAFSPKGHISQICVIGDSRKYISALVVPNYDSFIKLFDEKEIKYNSAAMEFSSSGSGGTCIKVGADFIAQEMLKDIIDQEVQQVNQQLLKHEIIQRYLIINRRFSAEADEVTNNLELKRETISKNFAAEIYKLYS